MLTLGLAALGIAELLVGMFAIRGDGRAFARAIAAVAVVTLTDAAIVFSVIGDSAGLHTFLAVMGSQALLSILAWRIAMRFPTAARSNVDVP